MKSYLFPKSLYNKSYKIREELKDAREKWARTSKRNKVNIGGDVKALLAKVTVGKSPANGPPS